MMEPDSPLALRPDQAIASLLAFEVWGGLFEPVRGGGAITGRLFS